MTLPERNRSLASWPPCEWCSSPAPPGSRFCGVQCEAAQARVERAAQPRRRRKATVKGPGSTFWYRVLDAIHYAQLHSRAYVEGCATISRDEWVRLFYRITRAPNDSPAIRAWERFKAAARKVGLANDAAPLCETADGLREVGSANGFFHIDIAKAYDGAFKVLGPPHPGGEEAEERALAAEQPPPQGTERPAPEADAGRSDAPEGNAP